MKSQNRCANTEALDAYLREQDKLQIEDEAREVAEGEAFREMIGDSDKFLEAIVDIGDDLNHSAVTDAEVKAWEEGGGHFTSKIARAIRARAAVAALMGIASDANYNKPMTEREQVIAAFLNDVTAYWIGSRVDELMEAE